MKERIIIYILLLCAAFGCESVELSEIPEYPITIEPLGLLALDELNEEYHTVNDYSICSTLNEYGLTGYSEVLFQNGEDPCVSKHPPKIEVAKSDSLVILAREAVIKNSKYTNVEQADYLEVIDILPIYGCIICAGPRQNSVPLEWKITFGNQVLDGMEVYDSHITVFVDAHGVNEMWGNWYSDFYAPDFPDVGYLQAQNSLVGQGINLEHIFDLDTTLIVDNEMLVGTPTFNIVPYRNTENMLEIRKAWSILVDFEIPGIENVTAFVDVMDGKLLQVVAAIKN